MSDYYGRDGRPITQAEWLRDWSLEAKRVARTTVDGVDVSTVWLGLNHAYGDGPPMIFETMTFGVDDRDGWGWRYSTEDAALRGHETVVAALREGRDLGTVDP